MEETSVGKLQKGKKHNSNLTSYKKQSAFEIWPLWKPTELNMLRKEAKIWAINQYFVQPNLLFRNIRQDQHTCQGKFWEPQEWPLGLDFHVVCSPLLCKLVSVKVTVCSNGNHMGWVATVSKYSQLVLCGQTQCQAKSEKMKAAWSWGRKIVQKPGDRSQCSVEETSGSWALKQKDWSMAEKVGESPNSAAWCSTLSRTSERTVLTCIRKFSLHVYQKHSPLNSTILTDSKSLTDWYQGVRAVMLSYF